MNQINRLRGLPRDIAAQDLIEYALIAALVSLVCVGVLVSAGAEIDTFWQYIVGRLNDLPVG
jgi:Flp pilus assembly pilin Flp